MGWYLSSALVLSSTAVGDAAVTGIKEVLRVEQPAFPFQVICPIWIWDLVNYQIIGAWPLQAAHSWQELHHVAGGDWATPWIIL